MGKRKRRDGRPEQLQIPGIAEPRRRKGRVLPEGAFVVIADPGKGKGQLVSSPEPPTEDAAGR